MNFLFDSFHAKWDSFFVLQSGEGVLQNKTGITKWDKYYKVGQSLVALRNNLSEVFLVLKTVLLNSWKVYRKLPITGSDFSNVEGANLL